jgi:hypothetical protein
MRNPIDLKTIESFNKKANKDGHVDQQETQHFEIT